MKLASKKFCLVLASAALVLAGCNKRPDRPAPNQTVLGQQGVGGEKSGNLDPKDFPIDPSAEGLKMRTGGGNDDGNMIRNLLQPVYFTLNESAIAAAERAKLQAAKEYLAKNPGTRLLLEGMCDWRGTAEYNLGLGDRRANAAKKYLTSIGVKAADLESNSKGSLEASKNADDATMAKDRRVELVIIKAKNGAAPAAL